MGETAAKLFAVFESMRHTRGVYLGLSHADVCGACDEAAKMAVLGDRREIDPEDLRRAIQLRLDRS
jgi:ATP-dependent 26S proteasome regulatory subunit